MIRSAGARLAALYTAGFALAVVALGATTLVTTRDALRGQFESRLLSEADALVAEYRTEGIAALRQAVIERDGAPGSLEYGLQGPSGAVAGRLANARTPLGWSTFHPRGGLSESDSVTVYAKALPGGFRLLLGDASDRGEALSHLLLERFALALLAVVGVGVVGGYGLTRQVRRRIAAMDGAAQAIIDGDMQRRIPVGREADDLDRLAATLNRMLDRIESLMESLRQVSVDIAHDLRTPLTRLRQRLDRGVGGGALDHDTTFEAALVDIDAILGTFGALLRIAQVDSGSRRSGFKPVDLGAVAATVVEAFAPSAEDLGKRLSFEAYSDTPVTLLGDAELLTQMIVNLVENAIRHTGDAAPISVRVVSDEGRPTLSVIDAGPGVPLQGRQRLFDRFYRLEQSRSTDGSGLGLALVAAVARLHDADIELLDAGPGLDVRVRFFAPAVPAVERRDERSRSQDIVPLVGPVAMTSLVIFPNELRFSASRRGRIPTKIPSSV